MKNVCNLEKFSSLWPKETTANESRKKKTLGVENNDRNSSKSLPKKCVQVFVVQKNEYRCARIEISG